MEQDKKNQVLLFMLDVKETAKVFWWKFFDWLAVISWSYLVFVSLLAMIIGGILGLGALLPLLVFSSIMIKSLAGGKRRAEMAASAAATRADVEALERRVLEAEMATLQAQIEPHFLFNTLALIGQLIETNPEQASIVHTHLIKYLRTALPQIREQGGGKLGQQLELSRAYLNIMQARMQERLTYKIECPRELEHVHFPSMMIQTLVENSIKHGLEPKTDGGHIDIIARQGEQEILVEVSDNGIGFDMHADDGIGLSNIRERLKVLYGMKASLVIEAPTTGGAKLVLHIPDQQKN
ncbi:sensor histidine kinase [Undibacterium danionis]|jgi:LytS/YehU family sensor histidine kinase|uniref:Sensor histidine kinase n=1 Tax=Undibacterium danionis TaxID=1812100 RepID=A0ABV6IIA3_9BURK